MSVKEHEIRTKQLNLMMCKAICTDAFSVSFEVKNGKRTESIPLECLVDQVNNLVGTQILELHNVSR